MLTADTITDEQIRELRQEAIDNRGRRDSIEDIDLARACTVAIDAREGSLEERNAARARCAARSRAARDAARRRTRARATTTTITPGAGRWRVGRLRSFRASASGATRPQDLSFIVEPLDRATHTARIFEAFLLGDMADTRGSLS